MSTDRIIQQLEHTLGYIPTPSQSLLFNKISDFIYNYDKNQILLIKGYAGTGKTTSIKALVNTLEHTNINYVLLAPTGRAAKVLSQYTGKQAFTIHKKIYRQQSGKDPFSKFKLNYNNHKETFFIVDEASMISNQNSDGGFFGSGKLLDDLIEYSFNDKRCKLILMGDTAQLPPVGYSESPALQKDSLEEYLLSIDEIELKDIIRQEADSDILKNATQIRKQIQTQTEAYPALVADEHPDCLRLSGEELIESITDSYDRKGIESTIIICRSNKRANLYNQGIRNRILFREEEISAGDMLMVVKNNYFWLGDTLNNDFIANGDIIEVKRIHKHTDRYGFRFADLSVRFPDYDIDDLEVKIMLDTLTLEGPALNWEQSNQLYQEISKDYLELGTKAKIVKKIKENPFFNALQVKFAYAVTCHKAQGGQWKDVYVDQGYIPDQQIDIDYLRWLYTGITRAQEKISFVGFNDSFFEKI